MLGNIVLILLLVFVFTFNPIIGSATLALSMLTGEPLQVVGTVMSIALLPAFIIVYGE